MKRKVCQVRLSPNEEARLIREEHERRRKLRIQQVREQQRYIALQIRQEVEQRRQRELEKLGQELREDWERQQSEKLLTLQKVYEENLELLGQGHRSAKKNEPDLVAIAQREEENHTKAEERYREALRELKSQRLKDHERQSRSIKARKKALEAEKERSAKVASLPPPPPKPIQNIHSKKPHIVKKSGVSGFAATHYHMLMNTVDREEDTNLPDAHEEAELAVGRLQELLREEERRREEQLEKARLRGNQALRREHLMQDRERLLVELQHMQQTDLLRRRQQVSQMPPQIFQPLNKRQETREDFQQEMEFAFEDMYTGERRVKGDLVVQLVPEPLPALSTGSQDQELDVTLDEIATPETEKTPHDEEQEAGSTEQETSAQVEPSKRAPRRALKKLLDRIRSQRNVWAEHNSDVPAADLPAAISDQIPERDTTIDTGSLSSEENKVPASELPEPAHSPHALETTEQSAAEEIFLSNELSNRIQEFAEEQKKREEELEREKQQQVVLLQELEAQKAKLEQMLLEAQQEREQLKAAVTQKVPITHLDVPVHDQEVTSVTPGQATELVPPPGEDDHTRRIREYQQRLLEQNRTHQKSVEVARQRLEEYQRALQIRYSMAATTSLPAVVPSGVTHPPLHSMQSVHLTTALQIPAAPAVPPGIHAKPRTSAATTTRESNTLASPPHFLGSSMRVCSRMLPEEVESIPSSSRSKRPEISAWLTDSIMQRVTEHLPESVRPCSVTKEPPPLKLFTTCQSTSIQVQPNISPSNTRVAPLAPVLEEKQRQDLQEFRRWMLEQEEERRRQELQEVQGREQEEERRRQELQEVHRYLQEQEEERRRQELQEVHGYLQEQEEERRRQELQEVHRRMQEQEEERRRQELQEVQGRVQEQEEERRRQELQEVHRRVQEQEEERRRQELQEVHRRVQEQREALMLQQRELEEEKRKREVEMEQMKRQKATLQALIHTDVQPLPETSSEMLISEDIGQTRRKLLVSLLRAIEEHNGGTLSHLETPQEKDGCPQQTPSDSEREPLSQSRVLAGPSPASLLPLSGLLPPPRAAKPPVTRIRLGVMGEQHELSAIQEVETPVNTSEVTGAEDCVNVPPHAVDQHPQDESESSVASDGMLQTPSWSSSGQRTSEQASSCGMSSGRSGQLSWRERLLMGAGTSPESSECDSALRMISPLSSDSGRGADVSGAAITSYRSHTEPAHRPPDPDCLSSTTISTGSYVTTDPEQNINTDKSSPPRCVEHGQATDILSVSSSSAQSLSAAGRAGLTVQSLFNDSSIQHIIDRYTKELNISLSTTGKTTDSEGSYLEESCSSVSQQSLSQMTERRAEDESSTACSSLPADAAGAQRSCLISDSAVNPIPDHLSGEEPSVTEDQELDSFRPLIGQLADQSSCLAVDHMDTAMQQLVGQPSAHSSVIGQLPGLPVSVSLDQGGWDSTLSRMIGQLSHQSSSHWLSGGQDFYAGQLMDQMASEPSTMWLDEGAEESRMRPLVGELDESAEQHSGSSGERTCVDFGVSTEVSVPSQPALPPEASSHSSSTPSVNPHPQDDKQQTQTGPVDLDPERTEDSFHSLLAEVTHNNTADPSMTFHPPEHGVQNSPEGSGSAPSEESHGDPSVESEPSPERPRIEEPSSCVIASPALHESFSLLSTSQNHPHDSLLAVSPLLRTDVELTAVSLSALAVCDETPAVSVQQPEETSGQSAGELTCEQSSNPRNAVCVLEKIMEAAGEIGILEQSEITFVSLTDTTLQDQETTVTDEEAHCEDKHSDEEEKGQKDQETEGPKFTSLLSETPEDEKQTHPVKLLEFRWDASRNLQVNEQKRRALLQRSSRRVEELKAKGALAKIQPDIQTPCAAEGSHPDSCKTKSQPQQKIQSKGGQTERSGFIQQKQLQLPPAASDSRLKKVNEMKICTQQQRKLDVSEMHQRTQRLYEQLEEVKHQRTLRSRQEAYAQNRLKAKEFHKKTLQKLRAKQTLH